MHSIHNPPKAFISLSPEKERVSIKPGESIVSVFGDDKVSASLQMDPFELTLSKDEGGVTFRRSTLYDEFKDKGSLIVTISTS